MVNQVISLAVLAITVYLVVYVARKAWSKGAMG